MLIYVHGRQKRRNAMKELIYEVHISYVCAGEVIDKKAFVRGTSKSSQEELCQIAVRHLRFLGFTEIKSRVVGSKPAS